jgi:hypothetical protein
MTNNLSTKILTRKCQCGIVFETYDENKLFHSNLCKALYNKKQLGIFVANRREANKKKLYEKQKLGEKRA